LKENVVSSGTERGELLRKQHNFSDWQGASADPRPPIRGFEFKGDELPGWALAKSRRTDALQPPRLDTFWRPKDDTSDTLLGVQVIERMSVRTAREALLDLLADFQSAVIARRTDLNIGDVVFGHDLMLVFARSNLVVLVRNAGRKIVLVLEPARLVDAHIVRLERK
jgi:hypothetical protein